MYLVQDFPTDKYESIETTAIRSRLTYVCMSCILESMSKSRVHCGRELALPICICKLKIRCRERALQPLLLRFYLYILVACILETQNMSDEAYGKINLCIFQFACRHLLQIVFVTSVWHRKKTLRSGVDEHASKVYRKRSSYTPNRVWHGSCGVLDVSMHRNSSPAQPSISQGCSCDGLCGQNLPNLL